MAKIEIGRFSALLRRALDMKGAELVATELSPEVSPVWTLEDASVEWDFLKDVKQLSCADRIAAGVGNASTGRLRNPVGSGVVAVVTGVDLTTNNASAQLTVRLGAILVDLLNAALASARDTRWPGSAILTQSVMQLSFESAGVATGTGAGTVGLTNRQVSVPYEFRQPMVLIPGTSLTFGTTTLNIGLDFEVHWHERHLPELEAGD